MNKRVHEIAKERGLTTKDVLATLQAAGVPVKAPSSSVDEDLAKRILISTTAKSSPTPVRAEGAAAPRTPPPVRRDPRTIGTGVKGPPRAIPKIPKEEPPAPEPAATASARPTREEPTPGDAAGNGTAGGPGDAHKRPTRDSLQGERAPGNAGGRRRVVIDSQASRRAAGGGPQSNQPPRR
jgi:translation initiation factor IF-2